MSKIYRTPWLPLLLSLPVLSTQAAELAAGPMAGPTATRAATVWVQGKAPGKARLEFWPEGKRAERRTSEPVVLAAPQDFAARIPVNGLEPGQRYDYRVLLNGKPASPVHQLVTQKLWQWRTAPPDFKVLLGSCAYINEPAYDRPGTPYGGGTEIFAHMAEARPDLTLWLGDNVYYREVDFDSAAGMAARWRHDRQLPALQALLGTGSHAAIWDDHDYGPNDANASFVLKNDALALFQRYWANRSHGLPEAPGIFTTFSHGDAQFFLLDNRWHRDAHALIAKDKAMFGVAQLRWLKNALLNSSASFKIIVAGGQFLSEDHPYEGWHHFPDERREFLDWLEAQKVNGVLFVSGDRHHTELLKMDRGGTYPLVELTCSPLTAGTHPIGKEADNPRRVAGTLLTERNFCSFDFSGALKERQLTIRAFDNHGSEKWSKAYSALDFAPSH